jgi:ATP-dependent Clp protease ATP-binding subunit ClpA
LNGYNFTDRVRKVLQMAREEAARLRNDHVGTEHLFLGLLREEKSIATQVLVELGVTLDAARVETARLVGLSLPPHAINARHHFKTAIELIELHRLRGFETEFSRGVLARAGPAPHERQA